MDDAVLSKQTLFSGWINLLMLKLRLGDGEYHRTLVEHPSGAAILAYDADRRVATILQQTRYAPLFLDHPPLAEPIVGAFDGTSPEETARREAIEEVGIHLEKLQPVGQVWITPSTTTERVHLFLGQYDVMSKIAPGGGVLEENEIIKYHEIELPTLWKMVCSGEMTDAKLYMLVHALYARRPELFTPQDIWPE